MTLFETAARDPSLTTEIVDSIRRAASEAGFDPPDDPFQFVLTATESPDLKASIHSELSRIAVARGLSFAPEPPVSLDGARAVLDALKDKPTQIPVGTPIALLFIAAALLFLPSILGVAGETMFGAPNVAMLATE